MKNELLGNTTLQPLLAPTATALSAGTSTAWISRAAFKTAIISVGVGEASGAPTAQSLVATVQHASDSSGTGAANLKDINGDDITITLTEDSVNASVDVDLSEADAYVGISVVVALTAGTTPALPANAFIALGDPEDTRNL